MAIYVQVMCFACVYVSICVAFDVFFANSTTMKKYKYNKSRFIFIVFLPFAKKTSNTQHIHKNTIAMNVSYLFYSSLFVFLFYRIISTYLIYKYSRGDLILTILQLFDLTFIKTLQINYQFQNITPCSPQRYLTNLEAMFESYPQFIIQLYFLLTLYIYEGRQFNVLNNWILIVSLF